MGERRHRLVDCNPHFVARDGVECAVYFECPEGHVGCKHIIPFTPALNGEALDASAWYGRAGAVWQRTGESLETLTLSPSIRRPQQYASKAQALAAGVLEEYFEESLTCALHIFIRDGQIEFCGDSR